MVIFYSYVNLLDNILFILLGNMIFYIDWF